MQPEKNTAGKKFAPSEILNNVADTYVVDAVNYQIAFNANGGSGSMSNQSFGYGESKALTANSFTRTGYSFSGWKTSGDTAYADKAAVSNLTETDGAVITLYAQWSPISYSISYTLNGGSISGQKTSYTIETDAFTLPTPTRTGYSFTGWTGTELSSATKSVSVAKGSTGNRTYTANWSADSYSITYSLDGGSISGQPTSYTIETATFTLPTPSKSGYSFAGWTGTGLSSATKSVSVAKGSTGNRSYTATWTANGYTVSFNYNKPTTDGTVGNSGTTSKSVTFNAAYGTLPAPTLNGYSFAGWYTTASGGSKVTDTTKYTTAGNSTLYAHWNLTTYSISYTLNGGSLSGQPTIYNVNTATFTLPTPTRNGYSFTGWTGSNGTTAQTSVSIAKNSTGNKSYTANWTPVNYSITYNLDGGSISGQPTSYNIETATFTLPTPSKSGYSFAGWTGTGLSSATKSVSVAKGSTGNRTYTATWTANGYTVSFNYNKPTTDGSIANGSTASKSVTFNAAYGTLPTPTLNGYSFGGWYTSASGGSRITDTTKYTTAGNSTLYAHWNLTTYSISYTLNGGSISGQPTSYNVNTATFTLPTPTRNGYNFSGWTGSNGTTAQKSVSIAKNSTGNKSYTANWTPVNYSITYNLDGGSISGQPTSYNIETATFTLPTPSKSGYSFAGWTGTGLSSATKSVSVAKGSTGNRTYTATWTANGYTVSFNYNKPTTDGSIANGSTASKSVTFNAAYGTLPTPTLNGYSFGGWYTSASGGSRITDTTKYTTAGNSTLYAHWNLTTYSISYTLNGGSISGQPTSYNVNTATFTLPTPTRNGYSFTGWTGSNGTTAQKSVSIAKNSTGNKSYTANWTPVNYSITYNLDGGDLSGQKTSYTIETDTFTLPAPSKTGYSFAGWTGTGLSAATKTVSIAKGSTGNRSYTATWTANKYTITYDANGGTGAPANQTFTFNAGEKISTTKPTRTGYNFVNWTWGGEKFNPGDTIPNGWGNFSLTAQWSAITYSISYELNGGSISGQPTSYNIESATFTLPTPSKSGYSFAGWIGTGLSAATKSVSVAKGSTGNRSYTATWTPVNYSITYNLDGGSLSGQKSSYTIETDTFTLPAPSKTGYTFTGWTGSNGTTAQKEVSIAKGSTGNKTYTANWSINTYSITYNLDGGTISGQKTSYDVETDTFTLPTPSKTGYTFLGWTGSNGSAAQKSVSIAKGSTGDKSYTANWSINQYTLTITGDNGVESITGTGKYNYGVTANVTYKIKTGYHILKTAGTTSGGSQGTWTDRAGKEGTVNDQWNIGAYDRNITLTTAPNTYTVKYDGNTATSGSTTDSPHTYDAAKALTANGFTKTGYTFKEWNTAADGSGTAYANNASVKNLTAVNGGTVTLYAQWTPNILTVQYHADGAVKYDSNGDSVKDLDISDKDIIANGTYAYDLKDDGGEKYGLTDADRLLKYGYHCNNMWVVGKGGTIKVDAAKGFSTAQDLAKLCGVTAQLEKGNVTIDLYPDWKINTGTVHYYPNADDVTIKDGSVLVANGEFAGSAQGITGFDYNTKGGSGANTLADVSTIFERKGYHENIVHNWRYGAPDSETYFHCDQEDLSPYVKEATDVHLKLYANWIANTYTVKFDGNGADSGSIQDISGTYDTAFTIPENSFVRTCYEFTGWNTAKDGSGTAYADQESVKNLTDVNGGTVTLYAQWKLSVYNVIFDKNNGTGTMANQVLTFDKEEALSANTYLRVGYSFTGWNTQTDGKGTSYTDQQKVTNLSTDGSDVILYAQWKPYTLTINYHNDGAQKWQQYPGDTLIDVSNMDIVQTETVAYDGEYEHAVYGLLDATRFTKTGYHFYNEWKIGSKTSQNTVTGQTMDGDKGQDVARLLGMETQMEKIDITVDLYPVWEIDTHTLTISNTVSGSMGNKAKDFAFSVKLSNSNPDGAIPSKLTAVFTDENGKETEKELAVSNGTVAFELSHKQSVTLKEIPYGTTYTVTETNGDEYDITRTNDSGTITKDVSVSFTNTKNGTVPTSADAPVPYPLMAAAFIGAAILVIGKKKKEKVK